MGNYKLIPIGANILVKQLAKAVESTTVLMPDDVVASFEIGLVVNTGKGYRYEDKFAPLQVKIEDRIVYDSTMGVRSINVPGATEKYFIMTENAIVAIVEEEKKSSGT